MTRISRLVLAAALLTAAIWRAQAAEYLVLEASGPIAVPYPKGSLIEGGSRIELPADAQLLVLSEAGAVQRYVGPNAAVIGTAAEPTSSGLGPALRALANFLGSAGEGAPTIGAVRGGGQARPAEASLLNTMTSGDKCILADGPTILWHAPIRSEVRASLELPSAQKKRFFDWPAGTEQVPWPAEIPKRDGEIYVVMHSVGTARRFRLFVAPPATGLGSFILFMAEKGCREQLELALAEVRRVAAE